MKCRYIGHTSDPAILRKVKAHTEGGKRAVADAEKAAEQQGIKERHGHSFGKGSFPYNDGAK